MVLEIAIAGLVNSVKFSQTERFPSPDNWRAPGPFKINWARSPNFSRRPDGATVDTIILHHTASSTLESVVRWFGSTESRVSAHYTIGKDASIVQHVNTFYRAWHAGPSVDLNKRPDLNSSSVGIEIVNKGDGVDPYPPDQIEAVTRLVSHLVRHRYRGRIKAILSHEIIATPPGRKNDPIHYPWETLFPLADEFKITLGWGRIDRTPTIRTPESRD